MNEEIVRTLVAKMKVGGTPLSCQQQFAEKMFCAYAEKKGEESLQKEVEERLKNGTTQYAISGVIKDLKNKGDMQEYIQREQRFQQNRRGFTFSNYWGGFRFDYPRLLRSEYWGNFIFEKNEETGELWLFRIRKRGIKVATFSKVEEGKTYAETDPQCGH